MLEMRPKNRKKYLGEEVKTSDKIWYGIGMFFKVIGIILLFIIVTICSSNISFVKFDSLDDNKGAVILKEYLDSTGSIKTWKYQIYDTSGVYRTITIDPKYDYFNINDTIK